MSSIVATATRFPPYYYRQEDIIPVLRKIWAKKISNINRLESFHRNVMVKGRHLALPIEAYGEETGFGTRNDAYIRTALDLGEDVVCDLLEKAEMDPSDIHELAFTTITGIAVPSIDARLMNRISFSPNLKRVPLFGLGCLGGAAGISRLADYLHGYPDEAAILLSVELCSLTIQHQDLSIANIISSGLFGDGSAAVLMVGERHPLARAGQPRIIGTRSVFFPETEYIMGWDVVDTGLKIVLSSDVSNIAEETLRPSIEAFLGEFDLYINDITHWIAHPGGPKVMQAIEKGLGLRKDALQLSWESLESVGNISSASVLIILHETLSRYHPEPGTYGLLMAMGPAFCAELVLLKW